MESPAADARRVRVSMAAQYVALIAWAATIGALGALGVEVLAVVPVGVILGALISLFVDPRRSWWGRGPREYAANTMATRRYRKRALVVALLTILLVAGLVGFVAAALGVRHPS